MITRELIEQWRIAATAVTEPNDPDYRHEIVNLHVFAELAAAHGQAQEIERVQTRFSEIDATVCKARDALQWFVDNDDTNIGQEGNEFWEEGLNEGIAAIAAIEAVRK